MTLLDDSSEAGWLLGLLGDSSSPRLRRLATTLGAVSVGSGLAKRGWNYYRTKHRYSVAISTTDNLYIDIHRWVLGLLRPGQQRALMISSQIKHKNSDEKQLALFFDDTHKHSLLIRGHKIQVVLENDAPSAPTSSGRRYFDPTQLLSSSSASQRLVLTASTLEGRNVLLSQLQQIYQDSLIHPPRFYSADRWGEWRSMDDLPERPLDSVVLGAGIKEAVLDDLSGFLGAEAEYARLGIPWHRGYLLYGPAGSGKSSLIRALASYLHLDVYYLAISIIENDGYLAQAMHGLKARSILVIEDMDIIHAARTRDDDTSGVTLTGLLNTLDGFLTPHGMLTFMTTNNLNALDPALVRAGRVDYRVHLGLLDEDQLHRLLATLVPQVSDLSPFQGLRTPAEVVEVIKRNLHVGVN